MNIQESLEVLGLSARESRVYQALLNIGPTTTTRIINSTGVPSSKIYDILERLEQKGLVTHILVRGKKEFHPASPDKLSNLIKEKENVIQEILPKLQEIYNKKSEQIQAEIYKGKEGLKAIFDAILREEKDWLALGVSAKSEIILPYYMPHFYEEMKKKKINLKAFFVNSEETKRLAKKLDKYNNIKIRYLPKSIENLMTIFIYSNNVAIIPITSTIEMLPIVILVKSKESADSYRAYFEWLWQLRNS
jgi:sugar-specific transcriptional regulator TrmB